MRILLPLLMVLPGVALAAGGGEGVPSAVLFQAINVFVVLAILHLFARKPLQQMFAARKQEFESFMQRAQESRQQAESEFAEIKQKLDTMKQSEQKSVEQAKADAEQLAANIVKSAEESSANMLNEAKKSAEHEIGKAKGQMREELMGLAIDAARKALKEQMKPEDQNSLQQEFSSRLRVVD